MFTDQGNKSKADSYISSLDRARSSSQWNKVTDLARKVLKHAPQEQGLCVVATQEAHLYQILNELLANDFLTAGVLTSDRLSALNNDLGTQPTGTSTEQKYIHAVAIAHLQLVAGQPERAVVELQALGDPQSMKYTYTNAVILKKRAVLGAAYELMGNVDKAVEVYLGLINFPEGVLYRTSESSAWTARMFFRFANLSLAKELQRSIKLSALRGFFKAVVNHRGESLLPSAQTSRLLKEYLILSFSIVQDNPTDETSRTELSSICKYYEKILFSNSSIPHATGSNAAVEEYCRIVMHTWENGDQQPQEVLAILQQAAKKTFQSTVIMRYHVKVLRALGRVTESLAAFRTYTAYEDLFIKQSHSGADEQVSSRLTGDTLPGVVECYSMAIELILGESGNENQKIQQAKEKADKLVELLDAEDIKRRAEKDTENGSAIPIKIESLARYWIARALSLYALQLRDKDAYHNALTKAETQYSLAISLYSHDPAYSLQYGLLLAHNQQLSKSLKVVREALIDSQDCFNLWHLLALLLSADEDYDNAFRVVSSGLNRAHQLAQKLQKPLHTFDEDVKNGLLQMKMTETALIEIIDGVDEAIDVLPDVFTLFAELYPGAIRTGGVVESNKKETRQKKSDIVNRIKRKSQESRRGRDSSDRSSPAKPSAGKATSITQYDSITNIVQIFWLWIAGLYRRAGEASEAEQAILEAENVAGPTVRTRVELGFLMSEERPLHAQEQFETALDEDENDLPAVLGLAKLVLGHSKIENVEASDPRRPSSNFFVSSKDEVAAVSRIRALLEIQVQQSPGRENPEAWWYLSQIFKKVQDFSAMDTALWKSLELEESRPIRDWSYVGACRIES